MQKFILRFAGLALLTLIFTTSCTDDPTVPGGDLGPEIRFVSGSDLISTDVELLPGEVFKVQVSGVAGDSPIQSLTIREDGSTLSAGASGRVRSISVDGAAITANNPLLIVGDPKTDGGVWEIELVAHTDLEERNYEFILADENANIDAVSINISISGELSIIAVEEDGFVSGDGTVSAMVPFEVKVSAKRGLDVLKSLSVKRNGELVDTADVFIDEEVFINNPFELDETRQDGFESILAIQAHEKGSATYLVELTDASDNVVSFSFTLTALARYEAVIINNADGPNLGGVDLDNGETVSRDDPEAEVIDKGIDISANPVEDNWFQQILPVNGATMRIPDFTVSENFSFETANSREAIVAAYESGIDIAESDPVAVDDLFLVKRGNDYFLMKALEVVVKNASVDNTDFYKFDVKQVLE